MIFNSLIILITLVSTAWLLSPAVGRSSILNNNNAHKNQAHRALTVEKGLAAEDLIQWNGGLRLQNQARKMNFMRVEHEGVGTQKKDDDATNSKLGNLATAGAEKGETSAAFLESSLPQPILSERLQKRLLFQERTHHGEKQEKGKSESGNLRTWTRELDGQKAKDRYDPVDNQTEQVEDDCLRAMHKREEKELLKESDDDFGRMIKHEIQQSIAEILGEYSQHMKVTRPQCMSSRDSNVYFFVDDPTKGPYGTLAAIRTVWKLQYPSQLRDTLSLAGFKVIDRRTVDSWISLPHLNGTLPKSVKSYRDFMTTKPCSWVEVDAVSSVGVSRGHVFFWSESVQMNRTQGSALGLSQRIFNMYTDDINRNEAFVDFENPDTEDFHTIRKILQGTYPEAEIGLILAATAVISLTLLCGYAAYRTRRRIPEWMRKMKKADREQLFQSVELRRVISEPERSATTKTYQSEHIIEPWNVL